MELRVDATRRETGGDGEPEHGPTLELKLRR